MARHIDIDLNVRLVSSDETFVWFANVIDVTLPPDEDGDLHFGVAADSLPDLLDEMGRRLLELQPVKNVVHEAEYSDEVGEELERG